MRQWAREPSGRHSISCLARPRPPRRRPQGASELCEMTAVELAGRLRKKEVSAREVMAAHLARIERVNPKVNAIVTLVAEQAMADAARADDTLARGGTLGVLHGLPVAHKDLVDTAGIRTTRGSPFYRDNVPSHDALIVTRIRAAGRDHVGKTNTPEFGAGSQTFNTVFGATRNPYDLTKTCGGSSGGAAAALACGMLPIADGSDTGGSLRNPAAFCNVVGLRPSPGRVASESTSWSPLAVAGPMARTVADVALFLSAIAGLDPRCPLSIQEDGARFRAPLEKNLKGVRVAWWRGLGGIPFEPEIRRVVDGNRKVFEDLGCVVEEAEPDFTGVDEAFPAASLHVELRAVRAARPAAAGVGQGHDQVRGRAGRARNRRGCRPRAGATGAHVRREPAVLREVRVLHPSGDAGAAVRRQRSVSDRDCRHADDDLHRLDAVVLVRDVHVESGDLGAGWVHVQRSAGRHPDRRAPSRRVERAAAGARLRAGDASLETASGSTWTGPSESRH